MLTVVAVICFLVQVYSLGYMAGDPGFWRYYAFMSLFAWAMTSLTVSLTLIQLYIFWELVGLASYLLIGFWYEKFSASEAGKKAFVMTRFGDVAFFLGLLLLLIHFGNLDIMELNGPTPAERMSPFLLTVSSLLIFGGIIGKIIDRDGSTEIGAAAGAAAGTGAALATGKQDIFHGVGTEVVFFSSQAKKIALD